MSFVYFYSDRLPVLLGDRILVTPDRMATVVNILMPNSKESIEQWEMPEGGVILEFDDKDIWLVTNFHEDFLLVHRESTD